MIVSFANSATRDVWNRERVRSMSYELQRVALRKLVILDAAVVLDDLKAPPGNRLELLKGDRAGQHSIRVNDQRRVCFMWTSAGPKDVEIVDYH